MNIIRMSLPYINPKDEKKSSFSFFCSIFEQYAYSSTNYQPRDWSIVLHNPLTHLELSIRIVGQILFILMTPWAYMPVGNLLLSQGVTIYGAKYSYEVLW